MSAWNEMHRFAEGGGGEADVKIFSLIFLRFSFLKRQKRIFGGDIFAKEIIGAQII